jgi:hypothetical protein
MNRPNESDTFWTRAVTARPGVCVRTFRQNAGDSKGEQAGRRALSKSPDRNAATVKSSPKLVTSGRPRFDAQLFEIVRSTAMLDNDPTRDRGRGTVSRPSKTIPALAPVACQTQQHDEQVDEVEV